MEIRDDCDFLEGEGIAGKPDGVGKGRCRNRG